MGTITEIPEDYQDPYTLAQIADAPGGPDTRTSPGAQFLIHVAGDVFEQARFAAENDEELSDDAAHEIADGAVPVYTHERWTTFVDLCAWAEDITDYQDPDGDMTDAAGIALYQIAARLANALIEEISEEVQS